MTLIKTSVLSAIATLIKIFTSFVINKIIAVYVGPAGFAFVAQFQNFVGLVLNFSGGALSTAITKYTAEYHYDVHLKYRLWSASIKIILPISFLFSCLIFIYSNLLADYFLHSNNYAYIFKVFAFSIPFFLINTLFMSILNGHKNVKKYISLNIVSSIVSLVIASTLTIYWGVDGALLAIIVGQTIVLVVTVLYIKKEPWLKIANFTFRFDGAEIKKLFNFAMITFTSVSSSAVVLILLRDYLTVHFSADSAGYWQGVWSLSQISLSLVTTSLATYYLPTLSSANDLMVLSRELKKGYLIMMPVSIIISLIAYFFKQPIILILFTERFMPMEDLFLWQFIGSVIKVAAWLIGYLVVAKAMVKVVVITEIFFAISFLVLTKYFTDMFGLVGVTHAYAVNSFLHLLSMMFVYHFQIKRGTLKNG